MKVHAFIRENVPRAINFKKAKCKKFVLTGVGSWVHLVGFVNILNLYVKALYTEASHTLTCIHNMPIQAMRCYH